MLDPELIVGYNTVDINSAIRIDIIGKYCVVEVEGLECSNSAVEKIWSGSTNEDPGRVPG